MAITAANGSGTWIGRRYLGTVNTKPRRSVSLTTRRKPITKVFDFWQAQEVLRRWAERDRLADHGIVRNGPYTVRAAVEDYLVEIAIETRLSAVSPLG